MKSLLPFCFCFFCGSLLFAQYPYTNYWQAEFGFTYPLTSSKQNIIKGQSKTELWSPAPQINAHLGWHFESMEGHFLEMYLQGRCIYNDIEDSAILVGSRLGTGKGKARYFFELNHGGPQGNFSAYSIDDESAGVSYGFGCRYRLTSRMSAQGILLRNHYAQFERDMAPYKHPARLFFVSSLYWNLNGKPEQRPRKVKKLSPRQQNRCVY
ncbi:MAG: hypothetical protein R2822_00595 [Spirosomataceae bacterium]